MRQIPDAPIEDDEWFDWDETPEGKKEINNQRRLDDYIDEVYYEPK